MGLEIQINAGDDGTLWVIWHFRPKHRHRVWLSCLKSSIPTSTSAQSRMAMPQTAMLRWRRMFTGDRRQEPICPIPMTAERKRNHSAHNSTPISLPATSARRSPL